ncbi:hypothetical protein EYF80_052441 [Liparis tanakae]|uniref:Uncharacterized protein n=1 Tax=Liparis tanakae TaxID=230148 RepID=A0A4Z2F860_9TELE|nr:hypothetical protein EYF80_052441 [Liparis tanakae]
MYKSHSRGLNESSSHSRWGASLTCDRCAVAPSGLYPRDLGQLRTVKKTRSGALNPVVPESELPLNGAAARSDSSLRCSPLQR